MTNPAWRDALRIEVAGDFAAHLRTQTIETTPWDLADDELLVGLEQWGYALTERDPQLGIGALGLAVAKGGDEVARHLRAASDGPDPAHEVGRGLVRAALALREEGDTRAAIEQLVAGWR